MVNKNYYYSHEMDTPHLHGFDEEKILTLQVDRHKTIPNYYMATLKNPFIDDVRITQPNPGDISTSKDTTRFYLSVDAINAGISLYIKHFKVLGYTLSIHNKKLEI